MDHPSSIYGHPRAERGTATDLGNDRDVSTGAIVLAGAGKCKSLVESQEKMAAG
jgi:hypothetical protein